MGTYYDTEVERQKKGDAAVNVVLPILAAIETIATAKATRGQNVGTNTLNLIKDTQSRREAALERASRADDAQFNKNLNIGEAARASKRLALEQSQGEREAKRFEQEQKDAGEKANTRKATIDRLLGIPNEYDEKTNTVTRSGVPGVPGLTAEDKAAIQADPLGWLENRLKPKGVTYLTGADGTIYEAPRVGGGAAKVVKTDEGAPVVGTPKTAPKSLEQIAAEAAARAAGAAKGAGDKPLSGDAAKLSGYVSTALTQGQILKNMIKEKGIRWVTAQYKAGNPAVANVIEDVADAKGRFRSGGAVNDPEANRFKRPFTGLGNIIYNDDKAALEAIDQVLAEAGTIQTGMKPGAKTGSANTPPPAAAGAPKDPKIEELKGLAKRGSQSAQAYLKSIGEAW